MLMRKAVSFLLAAVLLLSMTVITFAGNGNIDAAYPTIIVAGYSASSLYNTANNNEKVWGINVDAILQQALHKIAQIGIGLGQMTFGKTDYFADTVGSSMVDLYGVLACNPDGSSIYPLVTFSDRAKETQFSYLYATGNEDQIHEREIMADIGTLYEGDGNDHLFCFMHDFRRNVVDGAASLDKYIDDVREYTGADKVNLFAVSHGGEICSVYFAEYGDKNAVHNAVMTVPAIGGAALAYDVLSETIALDEDVLLKFIQNGNMLEEDYDWLVKASQLGILDPICNRLAGKWVKQIMGYWGSIWDFIPADYYEELKERFLDPVASAAIIEKSDYYHYELLPHMTEALQRCVDNGTNIYIIAGTDTASVTGLQVQTDGILPVGASTGAVCAPIGQRFENGYSGLKTVCDDPTHNHVSPAMNIDGSTGYLPEQTWYISGLFHGMTWMEPYAVDLCKNLITSDELIDVHTFVEFPQFQYAMNTCYTVYGAFDKSVPGYVCADDTSFLLTNLSEEHILRVISVNCDGVPLKFDTGMGLYLKPGQTVTVKVSGELPEESFITADVTVNYCLLGSVTPYNCRTMTFTVLNGDIKGTGNGFVAEKNDTPFDLHFSEQTKAALKKLGLLELIKLFYNIMAGFCSVFQK